MQLAYGAADLIYVGVTKKGSGSPKGETITRTNVKVKQIKTFSLNYYASRPNSRQMRKSRNLVVDKNLIEDIVKDGITYELMFVMYHGTKYTVREILHYYQRDTAMILDCEETR